MQENFEFWDEIVKTVGAKKLADVTGYSWSTVYKFGRHPMSVDSPDTTGDRGIFDRFESVVDLLASRAAYRHLLLKLQSRTTTLLEHALDRGVARPLSGSELKQRATTALRELADVIDACDDPDCNKQTLIDETLDVQNLLTEILRAAEAGMIAERGARTNPLKVS